MSFLGLEGYHVFITGAAGGIGGQAVKEFLGMFYLDQLFHPSHICVNFESNATYVDSSFKPWMIKALWESTPLLWKLSLMSLNYCGLWTIKCRQGSGKNKSNCSFLEKLTFGWFRRESLPTFNRPDTTVFCWPCVLLTTCQRKHNYFRLSKHSIVLWNLMYNSQTKNIQIKVAK